MDKALKLVKPRFLPPLDPDFRPAVLANRAFQREVDASGNGTPLVTSLMTQGLPGWGDQSVGHIVAVYGYTRDAKGTEYVTYADTAGESSGYQGQLFHTVDLGTFWNAVNQNSAQIW